MDQVDRPEWIDELLELMHIPEVERVMFHRFNRLKGELADHISQYKYLRNGFRMTTYGDLYIYEGGTSGRFPTYHFELRYRARNGWVLTSLEPSPPKDEEIANIFPQSIINQIGAHDWELGKLEVIRNEVQTPSGKRSFEVRFSKCTDLCALGTIRRIKTWKKQGRKKERPAEDDSLFQDIKKILDAEWNLEDKKDAEDFKELFYYMRKYRDVRRWVLEAFFSRIKPKIWKNNVELSQADNL
jgi:hypothetical protein